MNFQVLYLFPQELPPNPLRSNTSLYAEYQIAPPVLAELRSAVTSTLS